MAEYIERKAFKAEVRHLSTHYLNEWDTLGVLAAVDRIPAADVVSRGAYDKTDWERCVALTQLKEIGKGLGERMDDVRPVVFCKDCKQYMGRPLENNESGICARTDCGVGEFDFCSYGEKREESGCIQGNMKNVSHTN